MLPPFPARLRNALYWGVASVNRGTTHGVHAHSCSYCIVPRELAGRLCFQLAGCTSVAITTDVGWNKQYPSAVMLASGLATVGQEPDWATYTRPVSPSVCDILAVVFALRKHSILEFRLQCDLSRGHA